MIELISDVLLGITTLGLATYCLVLSRKIKNFDAKKTELEKQTHMLSERLEACISTVDKSQNVAKERTKELSIVTQKAEEASTQLKLLLASLHDLPTAQSSTQEKTNTSPVFSRKARVRV